MSWVRTTPRQDRGMTANSKQQLHDLVDRLDDASATAVLDLTRRWLDQSSMSTIAATGDGGREAQEPWAEHIALDARGPAEARLTRYGERVWAVIGALHANAGDI